MFMDPKVETISKTDEILEFTLSGTNVSIANSIRRTILSDIPIVVFKTFPFNETKVNILENTSIFNNEIVKQRLGCIPIHITDHANFPLSKYRVEVNVENNTENIIYVTTGDFKIKDLTTDKYISKEETTEIFPPDSYTGDYIDFVRLKPKLSPDLSGEKINLTSEFSVACAKEDGMYNVVSCCSYGFTVDKIAQKTELDKLKQKWKDAGNSPQEIAFEESNWKCLDGLRVTKPNSFDFKIETIGIYSNSKIVHLACTLLRDKLDYLDGLLEKDELEITKSETTMNNSYDVILQNEDYTIGKVIEYLFYTKFYEPGILTFCGFKKFHPHDTFSVIRLAYKDAIDQSTIKGNMKECLQDGKSIFNKIKKYFEKED